MHRFDEDTEVCPHFAKKDILDQILTGYNRVPWNPLDNLGVAYT
jgi:hypothetical protein